MCRGHTHHNPKVGIEEELLWKDDKSGESLKTLDTSSTSSSSFSEQDTGITTKKSSLKFKTQADSLFHTINPSSNKKNKSVDFSTVDIYVHALRLGDNPAISDAGPPLTISWDYEMAFSFPLHEYQGLREEEGIRTRDQLRVPSVLRMQWLDQEGLYSFPQIVKGQAKALRVARKRRASTKECIVLEEKKESARRFLHKWVLLQGRKSVAHLYREWKKKQEEAA